MLLTRIYIAITVWQLAVAAIAFLFQDIAAFGVILLSVILAYISTTLDTPHPIAALWSIGLRAVSVIACLAASLLLVF